MLHTLIHWLDDARWQFASTFNWQSVKGNIGAMPYQAAITVAAWPKLRKLIVADLKRASAEADAIGAEVHHVERDLLKPLRWLWRKLRRRSESPEHDTGPQ